MYINTDEIKSVIGAREEVNVKTVLATIPFIDTRTRQIEDDIVYKLDADELEYLKEKVYKLEQTKVYSIEELRNIMNRKDIQLLLCRDEFTKLETNKKFKRCRTYDMSENDLFKLWCFVNKKFTNYNTIGNRLNFKEAMKAKGVEI